jgi:hypothetical protein
MSKLEKAIKVPLQKAVEALKNRAPVLATSLPLPDEA